MLHYTQLFGERSVNGLVRALVLSCGWPLAAQVDLGLTPMRAEFPAVPGRAFSGSLTLINGGAGKTRVRTELLDLYVDESATPQFVADAPAEAQYSCRSWLNVNPMEVELEGRSQARVRFTVRVPPTATEGSFHCAIGFRTLPTETEMEGTGMRTAVRMIAAVYPVVGKSPVRGVIKELKLEQVPGGAEVLWQAVVTMENSGVMLYRPIGEVEVVDAGGKVIETQKLTSLPVLPMRDQRFVLPLKTALTAGPYTLRTHIDLGNEVQEASKAVMASPPLEPSK